MEEILKGIKIIRYKCREFILDDDLIKTMMSIIMNHDIKTSEEVLICKEA